MKAMLNIGGVGWIYATMPEDRLFRARLRFQLVELSLI